MSGRPLQGWQQAVVWLWAVLALALIYFRGQHAQIDRHVTNRLQFHAIPVAISVLYHGRPHDYTAFSSVAIPFQNPTPDVDTKIAQAISQTPPANDPTYFWVADDRGMGDYVIAAFALFGPRGQSLYYFYFVLLSASVLLFLADLAWHRAASALLIFGLGALYACISVIPLGNLTLPVFEAGSLFEPRIIELLTFVATLHLAFTPYFSGHWTMRRRAIVAGQAAIFVAAYHARSTIGWELVFVLVVGGAGWLRRGWPDGRRLRRASLSAGWPVLCLVLGLVLLKGYQHATYNPRYFKDVGARTVWHNALMGLSWNPHLAEKYNLRVNDNVIVASVRDYMKASRDRRLTPDWTDNNILGSLAGHSYFNWFIYEDVARDFYLHIWQSDTDAAFHAYLIDKPREIVRVLVKATHPDPSLLREVADLGFRPFAPLLLILLLPGVWLAVTGEMAVLPLLTAMVFLFACSIVPGYLFYPVVHTMLGAFATVALSIFVLLAGGVRFVLRPFLARLHA
jgi:hypothetical protein